jgi:hypothetical protein
VAKKLPENDFQKSSKAAELQEAHREMRGIRFIVPVRTENSILAMKSPFSDDATPIPSSN